MNDLSQLANLAEILGVVIVLGGVAFAVLQMRQYRQQRREMAAIELFRFFGSPHFTDAYQNILDLPDNLSAAELRQRFPDREGCAMLISTTMENIGVMTHQRIVPYVVVNNLMGHSTIVLWRKLEHWAQDIREKHRNPAAFEWFQWLAEMLERCDDPDEPPAFEAFRDWRPTSFTREL